MPLVRFTQNLQRHVACPGGNARGATVRAALDDYFGHHGNDRARGYVLDDHGALRQHMAIFINGRPLRDRATLSDEIAPDATIDVMQALSGG